MLISEFARRAGLSVDTVRFYIRKGLLAPDTGIKGGSNPYQLFTSEHLEAARVIRMAQGLGFTLREIAALAAEHNAGYMTPARSLELMQVQLGKLEEKAAQLGAMIDYTRAKIAWMQGDLRDAPPVFGEYQECGVSTGKAGRIAT